MLVRSLSASLTESGVGLQRCANSPCQYQSSRVNTFGLYSNDKMMHRYDFMQIRILYLLAMFYGQLNVNS